jgi:signal transduction histidine kinase
LLVGTRKNIAERLETVLHARIKAEPADSLQRPGSWWLAPSLRTIILGQIFAVSLLVPLPDVAMSVPVLAAVALVASLAERREPSRPLQFVIEAAVAGLFIGFNDSAALMLAYLIVPGFAAALRQGSRCATLTVLTGLIAVLSGELVNGISDVGTQLVPIVAWLVMAAAMAMLGVWGRVRLAPEPSTDRAYASATRLLTELGDLKPRLSAGLDISELGAALLDDLIQVVPYERAAVVLHRPERGRARLVSSRLASPEWLDALLTEYPDQAAGLGEPERFDVWEVPLSGSGSVGVVAVSDARLTHEDRQAAVSVLRQYVLPLQAAEIFQDIWMSATQQERQRLSREIHDGIAQDLASLAYAADEAVELASNEQDRGRLSDLRDSIRLILGELRISIFDLRAIEPGQPLVAAVSDLARRTAEVAGLDLALHISGSGSLPPDDERELTRLVQEALTNVRKHAQAQRLWVDIHQIGTTLTLRIADDGQGLRWREPPLLSAGMAGMQDRADAIGADLSVESPAGGGTVVLVEYGGKPGAHAQPAERAAR